MYLLKVVLKDGKKIIITKRTPAKSVQLLDKLLDQSLINKVVYY